MVERMLHDESEKMLKKFTSRAYENDYEAVQLEQQLTCRVSTYSKGSNKLAKTDEFDAAVVSPKPSPQAPPSLFPGPGLPSSLAQEELEKYLGKVSLMKWLVTAAAAVIIAAQAAAIILSSHAVSAWKVDVVKELSQSSTVGHFHAFLFLLSYALPCSLGAALLVTYVAPHAGGSGIPEIKAYLNGINMPQAFTFRTWASRSVGLFLVTSSGLFAGTEGPFAHLGGIVASAFAEGPPPVVLRRSWRWPPVLQGHRNRCEFISQGAAMGVAAAFGAPVGGILFSLEEASSFWSRSLTWRAFFGAMVAAVLAKFIKSGLRSISGSGFIEFPDKDASFETWELGTFACLGIVTGLLGGLFCNAVQTTLRVRRRIFQLGSPTSATKRMRLLEVAIVVVFTTCVCLWPAVLAGCEEAGAAGSEEHRRLGGGSAEGPPDVTGGICQPGEFSTMGFILLSPKEAAIKTLFSREMASGAQLGVGSLLGSFAVVWGTTIVTFGSAMPVGLFIPNILAGACLGRAVGQQLCDSGLSVKPDVYALMGAAGALAGFSRMTISLAVIFLEITNNMYMLLPLMLVIMSSKQVADLFGPSVYDIVLESNPEVHILEDGLSEDHLLVLEGLTVHDVATTEVIVLRAFEPLEKVMQLLLQTSFSAYPVVDADGRLVGIVNRTKLLLLVEQKTELVGTGELIPVVSLADTAPEVTHCNTPVMRAYRHFRASGLQHLSVVDHKHILQGLLTRTDFAALCRPGHHGVEAVRAIICRKEAAAAAGQLVASGKQAGQDRVSVFASDSDAGATTPTASQCGDGPSGPQSRCSSPLKTPSTPFGMTA